MNRRGLAETVGSALVSGGLAAAALQLFVGRINWVLVVGLALCVALAAAANYRARTGHANRVADKAPEVGPDNYDEYGPAAASDGGTVEERMTDLDPSDTDSGDR